MSDKRGFARMTPEERRKYGSRGGKVAQKTGRVHRFTSEEAKEAGRKGGLASQRKRAEARKEE